MMYDTYIMKRTQIYLDPEQSAAIADRAHRVGTTSSQLIREAVAEYLTTSEQDDQIVLARQRASIESAFGTLPRLPETSAYSGDGPGRRGRATSLPDEHRSGEPRAGGSLIVALAPMVIDTTVLIDLARGHAGPGRGPCRSSVSWSRRR